MYFNFEDNRPDIGGIEQAISWREGILLSIIFHLLVVILILVMPEWPASEEVAMRIEEERARQLQEQREAQRFVFVQPREEFEARRPAPTPDLSDRDRVARAPERARDPQNVLPFSSGNTPERVDTPPAEPTPPAPPPRETRAAGEGDAGSGAEADKGEGDGPKGGATVLPETLRARAAARAGAGFGGGGSSLAEALRNLDRYVPPEVFDNPQGGGGAYGPSIQFDTMGVEFGPWIRRFVAQIKRNWFIPLAAMSLKGRVVITFNVHKDGRLSDLSVIGPSSVDAFNNAAFNALASSNPTHPLPPEYPADRAFFTVTFYYNENPY
jgi:TonB family protein